MKQNFELLFLKNNFSKPVQSVKISVPKVLHVPIPIENTAIIGKGERNTWLSRHSLGSFQSVYQNFERRTRSRPPKGPKLPGGNRPAKYAPHVSPSIATHRRVRFEKPFETMIRKFISIYGNKYTVLL